MTRTRLTAAERREQIVDAAIARFAVGGYHGTSTEDIAADTGLSQPYLFRLFNTKAELFLACCETCSGRVAQTFEDHVEGDTPQQRRDAMGSAYSALLRDETLLRFQQQMFAAASGDPVLRERIQANFRALIDTVRELSHSEEEDVIRFIATGMLLNVTTSLGIDDWPPRDVAK